MVNVVKEGAARVDPQLLSDLERRLAIAKSKIEPGQLLNAGTPREQLEIADRAKLDKITNDIVQSAKKKLPVKIHAHAEALPLFDLFKEARITPPPDLKVA